MNVSQNIDMKLSEITNRKFIESYPGNGRKILTPNGYTKILEVHKTIPYRKYRIELENGMFLECAFNHVIICEDNTEVYAKDSLHKKIKTNQGISKVSNVIDLKIEEHMYDISIDSDDELYYSNGILSHNSGKTISTAIYLVHSFIFDRDKNIGIVANKGKQAMEFLLNTKNILLELPIWMQIGVMTWNKTNIEGENKMRILTDVPSADSFRGFTISILIVDECAFIRPNIWQQFSDSIFPSQSGLAWKKNIILSTANGMNHFYDMVEGARNETNGMKIYEVDWKDVPRYDSKGEVQDPEKFMGSIIKKYGPIYFNQNYGCEFLGSSHTLISRGALQKMQHGEIEEIRDGKLKIYEYPIKGHKYIMSVDPAKDGTDAFAVQIIDTDDLRFKQVASAQLQIDYLLMPEFLKEWAEFYYNPYMIIENNEGAGQSIADQMFQTYEYENLHFDKDVGRNRKKRYPGFRTTAKTRKQILQTLKLFIENGRLLVQDKKTINEFYQFIMVRNKFQAEEGSKDDLIMSLALTFVPFCNVKNFEDMTVLVDNLYHEDDNPEREKIDFSELLVLGNFDTASDDNRDQYNNSTEYENMEDALADQDGFY